PTGTVTFMDGSVTLGTGMLSSSGGAATATFSTSSLTVGTHTITASYSGDGSFAGSTGTLTGGQVVKSAGGNVIATLNPGTGVISITGDSGNNTITITQVSPGVIQVAGTATTINQSSNPAQFNFVTGITISFLNGKDSVTMNNVSLSGDISISAGSGSD